MLSTAKKTFRLAIQALPLFALAAFVMPAAAQSTDQVVSALQAMPVEAQRNSLRRYMYFYERRAYPFEKIPAGAMTRARQDHERKFGPIRPPKPDLGSPAFAQNTWTEIGPTNIATSQTTSGRVNSIAIDPSNTSVLYAAAATGGVWKSTNGGTSWTALTDTQCSLAMGSIAIDPTNTQVIYAGTGEENFSADSYYGCGILKSTNGGASWTQIGAANFDTATGGATISKILINPSSTQTVFVASDFGLYRTTNGGSSFTQVMSQTPVTDLVMDPTNSNILYAAVGYLFGNANNGVYKSTDGGATWGKLAGGLPTTNVGRIGLAIGGTAAAGTLIATVQNSSSFALLGLWTTTNSGTSWTQLTATGASCSSQCWYDMYVAIDPSNANTVYFGGLSLYKSTNGGASFSDIGTIHVDHHAFAFQPGGPTTTIYAGSDGGIYKSTNGGSTWTSLNTNIAITQFYNGLSLHPTNANIVLGGTQDNHTLRYTGSPAWSSVSFSGVGGCDGGFTVIDQATPTTQYAECQWGGSFSGPRRSDSGGSFVQKTSGINLADSGLFIPPIIGSPSSATTLYFGTVKVYKTTNSGDSWTPSATTIGVASFGQQVAHIAQAPSNANIIYASAASKVWKSSDGNANYTQVSTGLPNRVATYVAVHPTDPNTVFATFSGFGTGHVWKSTNGGTSWTNISSNLPDIPVNAIVLDPAAPTTEIFVGTDLGVYRTNNGGASWTVFNTGLPNVPVLDLKYNPTTSVLAAATHGRGVFKAIVSTPALTVAHDFNGDTRSDIAWRDNAGNTAIWLMNGGGVAGSGALGNVPTAWAIVGQRDFNGDGKADLLWRDNAGNTAIWFMNGTSVGSTAP
ncbi:MAG: hypothetical protein QOD74_2681, partial [Variibacter sp.]|nr:hypothetical protein [Variibacter sp.]